MLVVEIYEGADDMARGKTKRRPVDWDALEIEAFNLRFERLSTEEKVKKARELAAKFRRHNQPLPAELMRLLRGRTITRKPKSRASISPLDQYLKNPALLRKK
jgi:hypothetical protein